MWVEGARDGKWDWEKMGQGGVKKKGQVGGAKNGWVELDGGLCVICEVGDWGVDCVALGCGVCGCWTGGSPSHPHPSNSDSPIPKSLLNGELWGK